MRLFEEDPSGRFDEFKVSRVRWRRTDEASRLDILDLWIVGFLWKSLVMG